MTTFADVEPIADAVLFEGYVLYPYRANDAKNRVRWQFGVLVPPAYAALDPSERSGLSTDCLLEGRDLTLTVRVRFLHVRQRRVERAEGNGFGPAASLDVGDATYLPGEEAAVREADVQLALPGHDGASAEQLIELPGGDEIEVLLGADASVAGRLVHDWLPVRAQLRIDVERLAGPYGTRRVRLRLDNRTAWTPGPGAGPARPEALRRALVSAHLLVATDHGAFLSQLDPPEWARGYVAACENVGAFPVLAGPADRNDVVLASPIILYDHPQVAPESAISFCDATEMDEMLTLRAMTLTDAEKRQARGSDPRAAGIVDQVDHLPPELMERLHGAIRSMHAGPRPAAPAVEDIDRPPWWDPGADGSVDPDTDEIVVDGISLRRGVAVRLRPGSKRADAQDMFLAGRVAHVEAVLTDVDGQTHLAVALDELVEDGVNPHGRFLYFAPDEVEPIALAAAEAASPDGAPG